MKYRTTIFVSLIFLLFAPAYAGAEYFVIDHYQVNVDVMENNAYNITEVINVDFFTERHGIFRTLPLKFDKNWVKISNVSVSGHKSHIETSHDSMTIRIGSADSYVKGKVQYTISYTYDVGADNINNMDEFNHNIIGTQWDTEIKAVDFTVHMPKNFDAKNVNCTSGDLGSTENNNVKWEVHGNKIVGRIISPLQNNQALTVALPLPEGYWVGAKKHSKPESFIFTVSGYPLYALCVILAFLLWYKKGRDNKLFPAVEFEPPEGLNPSEIGYIIDGVVDSEDVTSLVLYWANLGLLQIEEAPETAAARKKVLTLVKLKDIPGNAKSYEKRVFRALFSLGDGQRVSTKELEYKFYTTISAVQFEIERSFQNDQKRAVYVERNGCSFTFLVLLLAITPLILIFLQTLLPVERGPLWIMAPWITFFLVGPSYKLSSMMTDHRTYPMKKVIVMTVVLLLALIGTYLLVVMFAGISVYKCAAAAGSSMIASFFASIMSIRTEYGDRILARVLGFKEFIRAAEKDRLERMFEENPQYFYNILPYALVMGLSEKWANHFENMAVQPPDWYRGHKYTTFNTVAFTDHLDKNFHALNSAMGSSPSSGGSSGSSSSGGSSSGGSGGGGGGSW